MNTWGGIRFFFNVLNLKIARETKPLTVIFNVTNRCNCRCTHCYASYYERNRTEEMSTAQAKALIGDLRRNGCQRISFSGGEPLLRSDLDVLIEAARSQGMSVTVNSNGILVPKHLPMLKKVDNLAISLDGRPCNHDLLRGAGTGTKALEGIREAVDAGISVHTNTVLNKYNLNDIDYVLNLARSVGFKAEFNLAISNIFGKEKRPDSIKPNTEGFRAAIRHIIAKKKARAPILFSAKAYESVLDCWPDFDVEGVIGASPPRKMPKCPAGRFFCLIDADGTLWACPHLIGKITAKNALKEGVAAAWRIAEDHPCTGCYQVYHHEFSLLMDLNPRVVWNYINAIVPHKIEGLGKNGI